MESRNHSRHSGNFPVRSGPKSHAAPSRGSFPPQPFEAIPVTKLILPAALLLALVGSALGQVGQSVDATLSTGETIRATLVSDDGKTVVFNHPLLGTISLAKETVKSITPTPVAPAADAAVAAPAAPAAAPAPAAEPAKAPEVKKDPESFWDGWAGKVELGITGAAGNSENFNFRGAFGAKRETSKIVTTLDALYVYGSSDGTKSTDRGEAALRNDWKIEDSKWRFFVIGKGEYDQFQDWDWRASVFAGVGYEFIKSDTTSLLGRAGLGFSKEFGGSDNRIKPEANLGLDFEHKLDERQKIVASLDYFPSLLNFPKDYRVIGKAAYEVLVDPKNNLSLKLGVEDRYQSAPGDDKKRNDLLYFATLVYTF